MDVSSQVKYSNTPATTTDDDNNPTEVSSQVKDSNYIIVHSEDLNVGIRKHVTCKTCTMHYHHERRVRFHRYSDKYHKEMAGEVLQSDKSTVENLTPSMK